MPGSLVFLHLSRGLAGPALWMSIFTCLLSPDVFLCWVSLHFYPCVLVVTGSPDVCLSSFICPTLSSGVRLSGCLLCAFTCLWPCVSGHASLATCLPIYPFPNFIVCPQSPVCLCGDDVRLFRLFAFVCLPSFVCHLSRTSSVSEVICLQSYVCLSVGVLF